MQYLLKLKFISVLRLHLQHNLLLGNIWKPTFSSIGPICSDKFAFVNFKLKLDDYRVLIQVDDQLIHWPTEAALLIDLYTLKITRQIDTNRRHRVTNSERTKGSTQKQPLKQSRAATNEQHRRDEQVRLVHRRSPG